MMGQGGGHGLVIDKIGVVLWCLFCQGGGLCPIVFLARVYLLLCSCWFQFRYLLGHGGGRDCSMMRGRACVSIWDQDRGMGTWSRRGYVILGLLRITSHSSAFHSLCLYMQSSMYSWRSRINAMALGMPLSKSWWMVPR